MDRKARNLLAVLAAVPFLVGCPSADGAPPDDGNARNLTTSVEAASDSTVDLSAFWSGQADEWRWRIPSDSGAVTVEQVTVTGILRADTAETRQFCVNGVNFTGAGDELAGPEACASFEVPAIAVAAPDAPTIDSTSVDTTTSTALIENLQPADYELDVLTAGIEAYIDRDYTITDVPERYEGWTYIRTANRDKRLTGDSVVRFTFNADTITLGLAYDTRASTLPDWLREWTVTGDTIETTNVPMAVYTRTFVRGSEALARAKRRLASLP